MVNQLDSGRSDTRGGPFEASSSGGDLGIVQARKRVFGGIIEGGKVPVG